MKKLSGSLRYIVSCCIALIATVGGSYTFAGEVSTETAGHYTSNSSYDTSQNPQQQDNERSFSAASSLFYPAILTEYSTNKINNHRSTYLKKQLSAGFIFSFKTHQISVNTGKQYIIYSKNIVVGLPPCDIIFPFHCFW